MQQRNATKPRVNTVRGVPLVGRGKPSLGAHKAKQPPGHALTQRGTTQRRPARRRATKGVTAVGRSGKGSTTVGWPGWFPWVVTETDTGHEGPERPRGPTGGPLAATDGERRVGRALPRHGHAPPQKWQSPSSIRSRKVQKVHSDVRVLRRLGTHKSRVAGARTYLRRPSKARGAA